MPIARVQMLFQKACAKTFQASKHHDLMISVFVLKMWQVQCFQNWLWFKVCLVDAFVYKKLSLSGYCRSLLFACPFDSFFSRFAAIFMWCYFVDLAEFVDISFEID